MENLFELSQFAKQAVLFGAIIFAFIFWIWGKIRYDLVALIALSIIVLSGVIPYREAFLGFSNPAVIIVASVLIMSRGVINTGFIDFLISKLSLKNRDFWIQISVLSIIAAIVSAFVYDAGAIAIMMPLVISIARKSGVSPALFLLPVAFSAHLGGFLTLIGNAPNIIISTFRYDLGLDHFSMFDFSRVGIWIVLATILFISLIGWRLIPKRKEKVKKDEVTDIKDYTSELLVSAGSSFIGTSLADLKGKVKEEFSFPALIRGGMKIADPESEEKIMEGDILLTKGDTEAIRALIKVTGFKPNTPIEKEKAETTESEAVVGHNSKIIGSSLEELRIDLIYKVEVVAISRQGREIKEKLKGIKIAPGDILLLKGEEEDINFFLLENKLLPLAERYINLQPKRSMALALSIFAFSVILATFNVFPVEFSFFLGAIMMILTGVLTIKQAYQNIDWSIIILLGSLIPFSGAMVSSGAADLISSSLLSLASQAGPLFILAILLAFTIIMSDLINNIGMAVLMTPIAILLAQGLGVSIDPFLMAVAIGGSCAFLTPVGHQVNLIVMEPGGYKFTDYFRVGIFLNIIIFVIGITLLPIIWPL